MHIGSVKDSCETLKKMCNDKSVELLNSIEIDNGEEKEVVFWTSDLNELIGKSTYKKNDAGIVTFSLDFTECAL